MSEQILLQGKLLGIEDFLLSSPGKNAAAGADTELLASRSQWITLLTEVLPRGLLAELGLARILLGSSGGGQFLLVLPGEARRRAEELLRAAARQLEQMTGERLLLIWTVTENLGDWSVVRRRLNEGLLRTRGTPLASADAAVFQPFLPAVDTGGGPYFRDQAPLLRGTHTVGWSPDAPAVVAPGSGKYTWPVSPNLSADGITLSRHAAPADDGDSPATLADLARRAQGRPVWGVLRGDVDSFGVRLRRVTTIEEHVQLSVLYKQFFAGELEVVCSLPEFWRKVTIMYSGGDDFAVYGSWDALILVAREIQRLFHRFTEENLKDFPGAEGKTISMAVALAPEMDCSLAEVYRQSGLDLELAKAAEKNCISVFDRILEWRQLNEAAELKESVTRLVGGHRSSRHLLTELRGLYARQYADSGPGAADPRERKSTARVWRMQRRLNRVFGSSRDKELQKLRSYLTGEQAAREPRQTRLRPAGAVALDWASLATEG
jgi:CRISPR-associated protein Csm1